MKKSATKKIVLALSLSTLFAACPAGPGHAQVNLVKQLYSAGLQEYELGDYRSALKKLTRAMELGKDLKFSDFEISQGYLTLAETLRSLGKYKDAEKYFNLSEEHALKSGMRKNLTLSRVYNNMGVLYFENSQYPQAEQAWLKSERISGNFRYLPINNLARLYLNWGKFKEAEEYMEKADKLAHGRGATKSISAPYYYFNKATYEQLKGDYAASEKDYDKAIEGIQKLVAKTHLYYTIVLSGKADLYVSQSRFEEAEKEIRTILDTRKKNLGEENPQTAQAMVLLANVLADQGKYAEARQYAARAIEINNIIFEGKENLFVANARHSLGNIKRQEGRYDEASQLLKEALAMEESVLGADHLSVARTKRDLARVYLDQNSYPEAEKLLLSSNSIIEARTGQDHPERARSHRDLGNLYLREGLYDKAEGHFLKALTLARAALGENNQVTADSARDLGDLYSKKENYEKAVEYLSVAQNIDKAVFGENAPQVAADLMALATAYDALGQGSRATPLIEQAQQIKQKLDGGAVVTKPELQIPVAFTPLENQPIQNKWALAIGISNFKDPSINLKYAAKDATDFTNFLVEKGNFKKDHVRLLTDEKATRQNIIDNLGDKWLGKLAHKNDLIIVYVSSHGSRSQEDAGGVNFLVAHDTDKNSLLATGIPMQWLTKMIKEQVKSDRVVLILDVCHSGAAAEGGKALNRIIGMDPNQMTIGSGQMVLCSSRAEQVSWESKKYENSVFTRRLIEALQVDKEKTTLLQAYKRLKVLVESEVLRDRSNLQTPVLWNKDWQGADPVISIETMAPVSSSSNTQSTN